MRSSARLAKIFISSSPARVTEELLGTSNCDLRKHRADESSRENFLNKQFRFVNDLVLFNGSSTSSLMEFPIQFNAVYSSKFLRSPDEVIPRMTNENLHKKVDAPSGYQCDSLTESLTKHCQHVRGRRENYDQQ